MARVMPINSISEGSEENGDMVLTSMGFSGLKIYHSLGEEKGLIPWVPGRVVLVRW